MQTMKTAQPPRRIILRLPAVEAAVGLKRSSIYNLMAEGRFPTQRRISARAVGWDSVEIERWIAERLA